MILSKLSLLLLLGSSCSSPAAAVPGSDLLQKPLLPPDVSSPATFSPAREEEEAPSYRESLVSLHKSLVEISSVSGNESAVGEFLVEYLIQRDFVVEVDLLPPNSSNSSSSSKTKPRFNVIAWPAPRLGDQSPKKKEKKPKVLVTSHIDTVPPFIPYSRHPASGNNNLTRDTLFRGRGSADAKASVAAQVIAVLELLAASAIDPEDVVLLFVVGEEITGDGMRHFSDTRNRNLKSASSSSSSSFTAAIFGEPTEGKLACGHKGFFVCEITARGKAGHSGYPWLGLSATEVLVRGLVAVLDADLDRGEAAPGFGRTTVNVGLLEGGVAANVIPERAYAKVAGRVAVGPQKGGGKVVGGRVREILLAGVDGDGDGDGKGVFEVECADGYGVVKCDCDVEGFETDTMNYGTDVPNLEGDHTRYLYGPGSILVAHGPDEAITLGDLEDAVEGYKKLVLHAVEG
ncbi:hypothetical protein F4778DRAFT_771839 [Xylariomycetidae sp. FL2044]|nr:hypothetical protein F4778DRAFT_771839 [Xylariomycetidae sp. FL2044]